jgi:glycosyltransferase involved in cell wall biosynthesis
MALVLNQSVCPQMNHSFALCFEDRFSDELYRASADVTLLGGCRIRNPVSVGRARGRLKRIIAEAEYDVVVTHSAWSHGLFAPTVKEKRIPLVSWHHGLVNPRHWLERWASRTMPCLLVSNSRFTAASLECAYPGIQIEVLYNPLVSGDLLVSDSSLSRKQSVETRERLGLQKDAVVIIQVSRMEPWKGHALHLEALAMIADVPDWICLQVGGAQRSEELGYVSRLKEQADRLGIGDRVIFLGNRSDVADLLNASDIHCQPNLSPEPFGNTFIEAMSAGLPVLTVRFGGALEIVDESCGVLVSQNDPDELALKLRTLVKGRLYREQLGSGGRKRALELCGVESQIPKLEAILNRAIEVNSASSPHKAALDSLASQPDQLWQ